MLEVLKVYGGTVASGVPAVIYCGLLAILVIGLLVLLWWKGVKLGLRYGSILLLTEWIALIICAIVIFREPAAERGYNLIPFWSYWDYGKNTYFMEMFGENILNVLLFIPIGFLLECGFQGMTWKKVLLSGCCLSVVIELLQLIFQRGFCEVDDVMHNTLGCLIGYGGYIMIKTLICHRGVCG